MKDEDEDNEADDDEFCKNQNLTKFLQIVVV